MTTANKEATDEAIYKFIKGNNQVKAGVTIFALKAEYKKVMGETALFAALDRLVANGNVKCNGKHGDRFYSYWVPPNPNDYGIVNRENERGGFEKPATPGHCLKLLNANMRSDMLRKVHERMHELMEVAERSSPLDNLIISINDTLSYYVNDLSELLLSRNPFNAQPTFFFEQNAVYQHDIELLKFHLKALRNTKHDISRC